MEKFSMPCKSGSERQSNFFDVCSKCRTNYDCCHGTRPPITKERRRIIEEYLKREKIPIVDAFVEEEYTYPRENVEGYCVFHDMKTRKCMIHIVKPETCVAGPITFDINKKTGKIDWHIKKETICPLAATVYKDKKMLQKHLESAKKEITELVNALDSEALKAILKKDEPETFKIDEDSA
jgi:Fe-S-cluster containining protein